MKAMFAMRTINENAYTLMEKTLELMELFGLPLSILAWMTVFVGSITMGLVLRRHPFGGKVTAAIGVGVISLLAHLTDYIVTLQITPDLSLEANPLWRNIIDQWGLAVAKWYGLTGKAMLAILSFEFYAYYLLQRERLFPETANSLSSFFRNYGKSKTGAKINIGSIVNYFSFMFALLGPFYFYIAFLNSFSDSRHYLSLPAAPIVLLVYLIILSLSYFILNYRAFQKTMNT
jgi:hypothetical protein